MRTQYSFIVIPDRGPANSRPLFGPEDNKADSPREAEHLPCRHDLPSRLCLPVQPCRLQVHRQTALDGRKVLLKKRRTHDIRI